MDEIPFNPENLSLIIKGSSVEYYSSRGYAENGDPNLMDLVRGKGFVPGLNKEMDLTGEFKSYDHTRVGFIPMASDHLKRLNVPLPQGISPSDMGIVVGFSANNVDRSQRNASFKGIIVVPWDKGVEIYNQTFQDPTVIFKLSRAANGGRHIEKFDGSPLDIRTGDRIVVVKSDIGKSGSKLGGWLDKDYETAPFPPNYIPNPL